MAEELARIEKPSVEKFAGDRKLFFVPLIFSGKNSHPEFMEKYNRYWEQVDSQLSNLESKLGSGKYIFHELVPDGGEEGIKALEEMKVGSTQIIRSRVARGAAFEAVEDKELLTELMDWSRILSLGLQSQKVFSTVYQSYNETVKKRNDFISGKIQESLKDSESAILFMEEGHHVQFPADIQLFYVSPPALDEIKRWVRDFETKAQTSQSEEPDKSENTSPSSDKA